MDELREECGFDPIDPDELTPEEYAIRKMIRQVCCELLQRSKAQGASAVPQGRSDANGCNPYDLLRCA